MCEVKGGCTCGNEYCEDDFDPADQDPSVKVQSDNIGDRKVFHVDVGTPLETTKGFIEQVMAGFDKK